MGWKVIYGNFFVLTFCPFQFIVFLSFPRILKWPFDVRKIVSTLLCVFGLFLSFFSILCAFGWFLQAASVSSWCFASFLAFLILPYFTWFQSIVVRCFSIVQRCLLIFVSCFCDILSFILLWLVWFSGSAFSWLPLFSGVACLCRLTENWLLLMTISFYSYFQIFIIRGFGISCASYCSCCCCGVAVWGMWGMHFEICWREDWGQCSTQRIPPEEQQQLLYLLASSGSAAWW